MYFVRQIRKSNRATYAMQNTRFKKSSGELDLGVNPLAGQRKGPLLRRQ